MVWWTITAFSASPYWEIAIMNVNSVKRLANIALYTSRAFFDFSVGFCPHGSGGLNESLSKAEMAELAANTTDYTIHQKTFR